MEANLLPYLVAHMAIQPNQDWDNDSEMATLISSRIAVTPAHAVPSGPLTAGGQHVFWLDFPQRPELDFHDVRVTPEAYDHDVGFAVLRLEEPLELPTADQVFSAEPVQEGALWETLCVIPSSREGIPVHGRVEGIEIVDKRSLIKLSVDSSQRDLRGVSGAPVMVDGKVIGIIWGIAEPEPNEPSKERRSSKAGPGEYWYAVPISAMIESKKTDAFRKLLGQNQGSGPNIRPSSDAAGAVSASGGYPVIMARLGDVNSDVRVAAVQAVRAQVSTDPDVRAAVMKLLADENSAVRAAAVGALSEIVSGDAEVGDAVAKLLEDENSHVREEAVRALAARALDQDTIAALKVSLEDKRSRILEETLAALGRRADTETHVTVTEVEVPGAATSGPDDRQVAQEIGQPAPQSQELDPVSFFRRLSLSSRRALSHAAGMRKYFTAEMSEFMGFPKTESDERGPYWQSLPLDYLIAGLFENEGGPTRRLFLSKNIDDPEFAMLIAQAASVPLPSRTEYSPIKLDKLPSLMPPTPRALQVARDIADRMGAAQIQSRHLLYGALSIKDSNLVTLLAEAGVHREDVALTEIATEAASRFQTIARLNADNAEGEDLLGIDADVNALSSIIAARDVATPLSIGLFGDWGSGKSFFMGKMRERIFELRDMARAAEGKSAYCDNVVQIEFNAWSYQEGDLWASLVTDIFESLAQSIDTDAGLSRETERATAKARLLASMASAGDVLAEQERKLDAAEKELKAGEQQFEALKKIGPKDVLKEAYRAAAAEPDVKKRLDAAADQLNIPEAERALGDLKVELLEIKHLWSAIPLAFKGGWSRPRDWIIALAVMAAVALIAFVGVPLVLHYQLDAKVASLVALLSLAVGRLAPVIKKAKEVTATIKGIRDSQRERIEQQQEQMTKKMADAQLRVQHAKENKQNLEQSLQEMRADTQLLNFVRQRRLSTDYTSRLGTVARARRDFKQLSDLMDQARLEHQGQATQNDKKEVALALPRIDRIVLYIDDLDRCSEDKVVKVLEAVHLLLAFKLFVVIVAVDSRWLLHSLRQHSAAFRASNKGAAGISDEEDAHWESTPLNYLEKIFQIPFYLRPMRERGFNRLVHSVIGEVLSESVDDHLEKSPEKGAEGHAIEDAPEQQLQQAIQGGKAGVAPDPTPETPSSVQPAKTEEVAGAVSVGTNEAFSTTPKDGSGDKVDAETQGADIQAQAEALKALPKEQKPNGAAAEANPAALQLREWERDFMKKLHPLIMSPRSAKRFINIYRLMRVSITNERDLAAFVGNKHGGQHRAALLLLAILTGYPAEATDILRDLLEEERPETWWQYIDGLEASWTSTVKPSSGSGSISTQRRRDLMDKLRLLRGEIHENQSCDQFVKWASKVARYSFESGRVLALTNDETDTD